MTNLTDNQKQVLNAIKQNGETSINDKDFCYKFELNTRSFKRTVKSLVKKGLLIETKERFTNFNNGKFFNDSFVFVKISEEGLKVINEETQEEIITDRSDIEGKSEFSCNDPAFDFKFYLLETAENYDRPLTKKAVENIFAEITKHHQSEFGDYDRIEYALCTESNEYPAGINIDNRYGEFYVLDFADTDVVLHLVK